LIILYGLYYTRVTTRHKTIRCYIWSDDQCCKLAVIKSQWLLQKIIFAGMRNITFMYQTYRLHNC